MIYTIGRYDPSTIDGVNKVGRRPVPEDADYGGGIAFRTAEEAAAYRNTHGPSYGVFGLDCDWSNTYRDEKKGIDRIIKDAPIRVLSEAP